jgi:hypothetical protein
MTDQLNKKYSYFITVENSDGCSTFKGYVYGINEEDAVTNANRIALSSFGNNSDCILRIKIKLTEEYPQLTDNQRLDGSYPDNKMSDAAALLLVTVITIAAILILFLLYSYSPMLSHE